MNREEILRELIYPSLAEIRKSLDSSEALPDSPDTILFGPASVLDSLSVVSLLMAVEEKIEEKGGKGVTLANDRAMSRRSSPYRTAGTLAEYIEELMNE